MTYEYICTACSNAWEAEQSISAKPLTACPKCGKDTAKRQISGGTGFLLKGGGWYADGYGSSKGSDSKPSSSGESVKPAESSPPKAKTSESTNKSSATASATPSTAPSKPAATD